MTINAMTAKTAFLPGRGRELSLLFISIHGESWTTQDMMLKVKENLKYKWGRTAILLISAGFPAIACRPEQI
jgi:hypothetical protein